MEVLNKNQRQTAIWRLVILGLVILIANAAIVLSIHHSYNKIGSSETDELKKQIKTLQDNAAGKGQGQSNKIKELEAKIKALETEKNTQSAEYKLMKTRNEFLEKDLSRCQQNLNSRPAN